MKGWKVKLLTLAISIAFVFMIVVIPFSTGTSLIDDLNGTPVGWSDDINVSNDSTYRDLLPEIAVNGDNIHIAWLHNYQEIYYSKSTDGGYTWTSPIPVYSSPSNLGDPYIGVNGNSVYIVWAGVMGNVQTLLSKSTDNGDTWSPATTVFKNPTGDTSCWGLYVNNDEIHIISEDYRDGANGEIYYRRSLDGGATFDNGQGVDEDRRLTFDLSVKTAMRLNGDGSNISIVWSDERDGDWETYWMITKDNGFIWDDGLGTPNNVRKISDTTTDCLYLRVASIGNSIHIVWVEESWPGPEYSIYYINSTDKGSTWNNRIQLIGPWVGMTQVGIDVEGNNVHLVWGDERIDGVHDEIFYKNSTDGGISWSTDLRLTFNLSTDSFHPNIAVENDIRHIVWYDRFPNNDREIYYKRFPDFPPLPTFNISLNEGWNLVSLPLEQQNKSIEAVLSSIDGKWDRIYRYNTTDVQDPWKSYRSFGSPAFNEFSTLNHKVGFWINITEPGGTILNITGYELTSTSIPLYSGWNLVSYPSMNTTTTVAVALFGTGATRVEVCNQTEPYLVREVEATYVMKPGEGYWVHVPADTVWVVDW